MINYAAVNAVARKLEQVCKQEILWTTILADNFPSAADNFLSVALQGAHLWNLDNGTVRRTLNTAWRNAIRKGLGMKSCDSIHETLERWFREGSENLIMEHILFLHSALHSKSEVVKTVALCYQLSGTSAILRSVKARIGLIPGLCSLSYKNQNSIRMNGFLFVVSVVSVYVCPYVLLYRPKLGTVR